MLTDTMCWITASICLVWHAVYRRLLTASAMQRAHKHPNRILGSLLAEGFRAIACTLSGQRAQWQRLRLILSCRFAAGEALLSLSTDPVTQLFEERPHVTCDMPTCTALKAAIACIILQEKRGLPAIRVPDSVVRSIWQAAESGNVGSVD